MTFTPDNLPPPHLKALSINNPWGWCCVNGVKDIENRDWYTDVRGTVLIHVGLREDEDFDYEGWQRICGREIPHVSDMQAGGIIGQVDIVDCVTHTRSPWFFGRYGFVLANAVAYDAIIPCKGALGFFRPDYTSRYKVKEPKPPQKKKGFCVIRARSRDEANMQASRHQWGADEWRYVERPTQLCGIHGSSLRINVIIGPDIDEREVAFRGLTQFLS